MRASVRAPLRRLALLIVAYVWLAWMPAATGLAATGAGRGLARVCVQEVVEGEVKGGESFDRRLGDGLTLRLQAVPGGWILRVLPESSRGPGEDYAELATPPYQSVNPLHLTTEFGFRAQDTVGWNPRRFRFATGEAMFRQMEQAYHRLGATAPGSAEAETALGRLVSSAPEGSIELLDAKLVPGGGDQTKAAALVATHFGTTAHTIEAGGGEVGTTLGRLLWIRFRVVLDVRRAGAPRPGVRYRTSACAVR